MDCRQRPKRNGLQRPLPARNTLGSREFPQFEFSVIALENRSSGSFRVPSPTDSEEEETRIEELARRDSQLPVLSDKHTIEKSPSSSSIGSLSDNFSRLGDSSSLFSVEIPENPSPPSQKARTPSFQFEAGTTTASSHHLVHSAGSRKMVVEREPPKTTPQKPARPLPSQQVNQPEFGKPSPLRNSLQTNNIFNIPKPNQPRPEHHRPPPTAPNPELSPASIHPVGPHQPLQTSSSADKAEVVEVPRPINPPLFNTYPRAPPTFSAINNGAPMYVPPYGDNYQKPVIDLTKPQSSFPADPAFFKDHFGAADPYLYVDAEKANENIKALLEGAFEDEEDKPRTRGRKKKVEVAVESLADNFHSLEVKPEEKGEKHEEEEEEEETDDGTVDGLKVKLLQHQIDGVEWMRDKEVGIKKKNGMLPKGGILADDMGLGKTIQSIALILINPRPQPSAATSVSDKKTLSPNIGRGTLVVAPLALIKQWEAEIKDKLSDSHKMKVCVHHGPNRTKRLDDLRKYDVVITTYQILVSEHGNSSEQDDSPKVGCFGLHWYRVILDEAHTIKNRNAKATQACYALRSEYRWCLTGTPMQNNLDELQSLIRFLRVKPYNELSVWKDQITRPLNQGRGGVAMKRLQFYLKAFMKRRTKDVLKKEGALKPGGKAGPQDVASNGFKITSRKVETVTAEFNPDERRFYNRLEQRTDQSLEQMMDGQRVNYASALVLLLRLRQACNHPQLLGGNMAKDEDALTTGQAVGNQSSRKPKVADKDVDDMADLLSGMSLQIKQCEICQVELSKEQVSHGLNHCTECEENLASQGVGVKVSKHKNDFPYKHRTKKSGSQNAKYNPCGTQDSDDKEAEGEWIVPEDHHDTVGLGHAGGTDDKGAEGGGESLASSDTDTEDESQIKVLGSREQQAVDLDASEDDSQRDDPSICEEEDEDEAQPSETTSAKIRHLLTILHREIPEHKTIVFSQFTSMLDLIEPHLRSNSMKYTRYDGGMRNDAREASLQRLRNDPSCRILLCSLKCGSLGLNLTAASRVVILEPFWNPFVEEQAIDRVHRLNQTKDVVVYKLTVSQTVEERILELQEKKRALANAAIEGKEKVGKLSMKDILNLFRRDAEHDYRHSVHDDDAGLGAKTRVLSGNDSKVDIREVAREGESRRKKVPPPVGERSRVGVKEDAIYGRRW